MCNASNHHIGCTCGFGGEGHLGKRTEGNFYRIAKETIITFNGYRHFEYQNYNSFIFPNAKCPVCKRAVYFLKLQNGGRVFFDEIGPPWPKHKCIHGNEDNEILLEFAKYEKGVYEQKWQLKGYIPFEIKKVINSEKIFIVYFNYNDPNKKYKWIVYNPIIGSMFNQKDVILLVKIIEKKIIIAWFNLQNNEYGEVNVEEIKMV